MYQKEGMYCVLAKRNNDTRKTETEAKHRYTYEHEHLCASQESTKHTYTEAQEPEQPLLVCQSNKAVSDLVMHL
jgi:hypothetical protein